MSDPFIAEVKIFAGNFAPRGWAFCNGQLLPIAQNTAIFSLIGTTYGGDGRTTTALPNMQGRAPMHPGNGPGLTSRRLGENGGTETVPLNINQIANHNHGARATTDTATTNEPTNNILARPFGRGNNLFKQTGAQVAFRELESVGGNQPHNNNQPFLSLNFIIALTGVYPSRS